MTTDRPLLDPMTLAQLLDRWALRREKVLEILDVHAAAQARRLAEDCRELARTLARGELTPLEQWEAWVGLRERTLRLLVAWRAPQALSVAPPASSEHGAGLRRAG